MFFFCGIQHFASFVVEYKNRWLIVCLIEREMFVTSTSSCWAQCCILRWWLSEINKLFYMTLLSLFSLLLLLVAILFLSKKKLRENFMIFSTVTYMYICTYVYVIMLISRFSLHLLLAPLFRSAYIAYVSRHISFVVGDWYCPSVC